MDVLRCVANIAFLVVAFQRDHLFEEPIRSGIVGEIPEVVILAICVSSTDDACEARDICGAVIELNSWINSAILALTEGRHLNWEQARGIDTCILLKRGLRNDVGIMTWHEGTQIKDNTSNGDVGAVSTLAVAR